MFKNAIFQLHWFLGITAGVVLAVVGITGAMLSYEAPILKAVNAGVITVEAAGRTPLPADKLLAKIAAAEPGKSITSVTLSGTPGDSARVGFAAPAGAPPGPGGRPRGESRYVDPYSGALLAAPRGEGFFRTVMQIHRWLAADAIGKQIVGASTVALVFFCLSGLYLRWPRKAWRWRSWLVLHWRLKGRGFLRQLHVIIGTWLVLAYLLMAVTGLTWSYPAFRTALQDLAGMPAPATGGGPRGAASGPGTAAPEAPRVDVGAAFAVFHANVPSFSRVTLRLPAAPGQALELSYLDSDPEHERASHRLVLDAASLAVTAHERHDQKPVGQRLVASLFPLHSGSYFGWPGLLLFCLASLAMPLFTVTGWQLYLDRRAKNKRRRNAPARA